MSVESEPVNLKPIANNECIICGASDFRFLSYIGEHPLNQCRKCRLQFLSPQPSDSQLDKVYNKNYFFSEEIGEAMHRELKQATARLYLEDIESITGPANGRRLLEIGCGQGDFLVEAAQKEFSVKGIELSPEAVASANDRLGAKIVTTGTIESLSKLNNVFDVIVANDVIEHVRDPKAFVESIYALLKEDGVLYCVTPSLSSLSAKFMGLKWMEYKEEHLFYFSPGTIKALLQRCGFSEVHIRSNVKILNMNYVTTHFKRFNVPFWSDCFVLIERLFPRSIQMIPFKIVASGMAISAIK